MMVTKGYKISLKALRINAGYSIAEVSKLLKVPEETVEAWENYTVSPTLDQAVNLSTIYCIELEDLTYGKFKPAKEIFYHNRKMIKIADEKGYEYLDIKDGEIIGFKRTQNGEPIREM